jgi:CheY-like chemotaxis protein
MTAVGQGKEVKMKSQSIEKYEILKPAMKKYLVVDDDDNFRNLLLNIFEGEAEVMEGGNGKEALALMETNCFDIVLCDANMPIMGGIEFCKKAMRIDKEFAKYAIIFTGDRGGEVRSFCHQNKILLLFKPLPISVLKASVKILLTKEEANQLSDSHCGRLLVAKTLSHYPENHKTPAQTP